MSNKAFYFKITERVKIPLITMALNDKSTYNFISLGSVVI